MIWNLPFISHFFDFKFGKGIPDRVCCTDEEVERQKDDPDWNFVPVGDQKMFGIKTAGLEDKAAAFGMLTCYARELKTSFSPYIEPVTELVIPHLKFMFHDGMSA